MASRLARITTRRRALVAHSQNLRAQLIFAAGALRHELGLRQLGGTVLLAAQRHRNVVIGAVVALLFLRARRVRKLAAMGGRSLGVVLHAVPVVANVLRLVNTRGARRGR